MSIKAPMAYSGYLRSGLLALIQGSLISFGGQAMAAGYTSVDDIIGTTESFLEQQAREYLTTSKIPGRHQVRVGRLDPRLRMHSCSEPLQASLENNDTPVGRLTVRVRCTGTTPWSIFVPAQVSLHLDIVVTRHPVKRNSLLQTSDLMLAERDISQLNQGYFLELEQAAGAMATRAMSAGQPVLPNQIRIPPMIRRGDQVVISATSGTISVRMPGEALGDGSLGQQIRVRNTRSQRVVHARVTAPGQVEVPM
ncbi:flagellar basal body P-ring formation chaperone FlgA [Thiopseudomonas denitrificans]|uniref:Flagella basal body P-ring formation protein FlgA n=1 Tax=Thiopseudomonas denitrificans TaxID=1501432 RepID=A0A4R6TXV6_9GAMM|nr:flagellar basal body P-ring formation chaperone FlgA [Thiopseudomonas denitrificans]TDQ36849.1 flagella basal body P-ring formation protein FlgA [Thiopseudomonas denitrificans]